MTKISEATRGVFIISATPFQDDGKLDLASADSLVEFYLEKGVSGITILGMMGEAPKLNSQEAETFLKHVLKRVNSTVPVVVGVSSAGLDNMKALVDVAMDSGAAGVMVAPIPSLKMETAVFNYYASVMNKLGGDVPLCYQDYPFSTGVSISVDCLYRLIDAYPQLVMLKHEEWPGLSKLTQIREKSTHEDKRRISILCGNGGLYLPQELARGADGAMTGFAYPEMLVDVCNLYNEGKPEEGENLFDAYLPLVRHEQQPGFGLALRKEILRRRGAIASSKVRTPGPALTSADYAELDGLIARLERRLQNSALAA